MIFLITLSQHLAILYADFLFLRHHPDRDWMASWVSFRLTKSRMNWDSSNFSLRGDNEDEDVIILYNNNNNNNTGHSK